MTKQAPLEITRAVKIRHALIILLDLADPPRDTECTFDALANKHNIPTAELGYTTDRLEQIGVIIRDTNAPFHFSLREPPRSQWIFEILDLLRKQF